jgi:peptidoglycan/LPS O-acetylase OafA/YrhL
LIAPFLIAAFNRRLTFAYLAVVFSAATVATFVSSEMSEAFLGAWLHEFMLGILSFKFLKARSAGDPTVKAIPIVPLWAGIMLFCVLLRTKEVLPYIIWVSMVATIVISWEQPNTSGAWLSRLMKLSPLQWLGKMSYSLYLSHMFIIVSTIWLLERQSVQGPYLHTGLFILIALPLTIAISWLSYRTVEKPFHGLGRRLGTPQ